ncbi:MAG: aminoglycoside phosphotransferase family protein [Cyanobacteria bacterium M_surface_10_m2_119]|nr:aminoglycoside phosphotransferase family protein [Cyanobacteria bacterium M_surface_10_m2_119]
MKSASPLRDAGPAPIASAFALPSDLLHITPLGQGNVNDTYLVQCTGGERVVLQRLNTRVFPRPAEVMANLSRLCAHSAGRPWPQADQPRRWDLPRLVPVRPERASAGGNTWLEQNGECWRMLTYVADSHSHDTLSTPEQAAEVGRALGGFHHLIHDLPCTELHDTLPGFHVTTGYLEAYDRLERRHPADPAEAHCAAFIEARRPLARVLEDALANGQLALRPIHGDPKVNNVLFDSRSARAVALVDLDTVKPGLLHYDIGDALRSACNRAGEECRDLGAVHFDLALARPLLAGYLELAGPILSDADRALIPTAARLISFELGLRFYSDHLNGNTYFKVQHPRHNLDRALVQFRLTESIEQQERALEALVRELG